MTIEIPEELARTLEGIAAVQKKSVEQLAVERLQSLVDRPDSPQVLLETLRRLPHPSEAEVDEIEAAIATARLPSKNEDPFEG